MPDLMTVKIDDNECNELSDLISEYVTRFRKNNSVECIYYTPYMHTYHGCTGRPIIAVTLVTNDMENKDLKYMVDKVNHGKLVKANESTGIPVVIRISDASNYAMEPTTEEKLSKLSRICNSTILYDKTGVYSIMKVSESSKKVLSKSTKYNPNIARIEPKINFKRKF